MQEAAGQRKAPARRLRALVGLALAVALWAAVGLPASDASEPGADGQGEREAAQERIVVVAERDTLWDLARAHAPEGTDRREWAAAVADRNGVDPREIRPGDVLRVPAAGD